jgi:hypothetical protein
VDDTDLEHFDMNKAETAAEAHRALQTSIQLGANSECNRGSTEARKMLLSPNLLFMEVGWHMAT